MDTKDLKIKVQGIVQRATLLKNKYVDDKKALVNYACIFSHSKDIIIGLKLRRKLVRS